MSFFLWWRRQNERKKEELTKTGVGMGYHLIKTGAVEETKLTDFLSRQYGVPAINLGEFDIDPELIKLVPRTSCEEHIAIPVNRAGASLIVAISDPTNSTALDAIHKLTGYRIEVVVASEVAIREAIDRYYPPAPSPAQ
jgi:type IV pilus assembly protein PilB